MEVRSGYRRTEVGLIPEDWAISTVGAEFSIQLGKMLDSEKNVGVPKPFLGNRAVQWGRIDLTDIGEVRLTPSDLQRFRLREGDLLVCEGGEIGRAAVWRQLIEECYYQKALHRLRPIRGYNVELMLNILQRLVSTGILLSFVTQTSIAHLPKDKFETVPIPVPPTKAEQEAIAEALNDADAFIGALEQLVAKKSLLKRGAMQALLTGKRRLLGFSGVWSKVSIRGVLTQNATYGIVTAGTFVQNGVKMIRGGDVLDGRVNSELPMVSPAKADEYSRTALVKNDVVIALVGYPGAAARIPDDLVGANISRAVGLLRLNNRVLADYLVCLFNSPAGRRMVLAPSAGSAQQVVNLAALNKLEVLIPALPEQTAIAAILSDIDAEIVALEAELVKARQLKRGMMQQLLTGRIRLT